MLLYYVQVEFDMLLDIYKVHIDLINVDLLPLLLIILLWLFI